MPHDEEKYGEDGARRWDSTGTEIEAGQVDNIGHIPTEGDSLYAKLQAFAGKYGVEQRGIERVPDDERTDSSMSQVGTMVRYLYIIL